MKISDCALQGLKLIEPAIFGDARGFFVELFHMKRYTEAGLPNIFLQDNRSRSAPGVLRGVHYQYAPPQGKLIAVLRGRIWDVAVDIRPQSSTYGKYFGVELNGENNHMLWIPPGFAHGFCVLGDEPADVLYKVTSVYNAVGEGGIRYDDPELNIDWPVKNPRVSDRDKNQQSFAEYRNAAPDWHL